jgi:hypothetical protein
MIKYQVNFIRDVRLELHERYMCEKPWLSNFLRWRWRCGSL